MQRELSAGRLTEGLFLRVPIHQRQYLRGIAVQNDSRNIRDTIK